jgi:hypothetical protein
MKKTLLLLFCLLSLVTLSAQQIGIAAVVTLDSIVVAAQKKGFDVEEFIRMVQRDRSFYAAFHRLRKTSYRATNQMTFFSKKNVEKAAYKSTTLQKVENQCLSMQVLDETASGDFYDRKHNYHYYTAKLYDRVFFTHGRVCATDQVNEDSIAINEDARGLEKYYQELKKLIFLPGEKAAVPIIGGKTEIFSAKLRPYYDYQIAVKNFAEKGPVCYVFTAKVKPEYLQNKEGQTVIKFIETYFERKTLQVMGRKYDLEYQGVLFSFKVSMDIALVKSNGKYLPQKVGYSGRWDVPFRKEEFGRFNCVITPTAE